MNSLNFWNEYQVIQLLSGRDIEPSRWQEYCEAGISQAHQAGKSAGTFMYLCSNAAHEAGPMAAASYAAANVAGRSPASAAFCNCSPASRRFCNPKLPAVEYRS